MSGGGRDDVIVRVESMLSEISSSDSYNPKIFKVYEKLRQVNQSAYDPGLVAIGPVHHNKDHLQDMEQLKVRFLYQFLQRENQTVERYVVKLRMLEGRARNCYSNMIQLPETDMFVEMLLLDGFFVTLFLRKLHFEDWRVENEYVMQSGQALSRVLLDLLLVENQLPFFILCELFDMTKSSHTDDNLNLLAVKHLGWVLPWKKDVDRLKIEDQNVDSHLLGMVYGACFSSKAAKQCLEENDIEYSIINSVSELEDSGIQFKMGTGVDLTDMSFTSDGVMQLTKLYVNDYTETILRNFIAYEQMLPYNDQRYVSEYSHLMTYLVKSARDAEILRRAGIFKNMLGDDETTHLMFNQLGKHVVVVHRYSSYLEVFESVNKHCTRPHNKWMAMLRRNYFSSPWATLSVIAAIVLLLLTTVQTFYSVLSYEN